MTALVATTTCTMTTWLKEEYKTRSNTITLRCIQFSEEQYPSILRIRELQISAELAVLLDLRLTRGPTIEKIQKYATAGVLCSSDKIDKYNAALQKLENDVERFRKLRHLYLSWWRSAYYTSGKDALSSILADMHSFVTPLQVATNVSTTKTSSIASSIELTRRLSLKATVPVKRALGSTKSDISDSRTSRDRSSVKFDRRIESAILIKPEENPNNTFAGHPLIRFASASEGRRKHQTGDAGDSSTRRLRGRISVSVINSRADNYSYLIDREPRAGITFARQRSLPTEAICTPPSTRRGITLLPRIECTESSNHHNTWTAHCAPQVRHILPPRSVDELHEDHIYPHAVSVFQMPLVGCTPKKLMPVRSAVDRITSPDIPATRLERSVNSLGDMDTKESSHDHSQSALIETGSDKTSPDEANAREKWKIGRLLRSSASRVRKISS